jgi:hypothetical protein
MVTAEELVEHIKKDDLQFVEMRQHVLQVNKLLYDLAEDDRILLARIKKEGVV